MKKGTISILITAIVSACIMDSCESILTKNKLTNRKITHSFFSPLVGLPSTYMIEHADFTRQCRTRYHTSFSLDSSTSSGGDGNRKQENKRPSLFKSLRIKSLVSSPKEDNVTKQPKTDINENDKPISTKPVRTKKESVPTAIENFQEDVSIYSNEDISTPKKVHEQSEVGDTKPTKKAKKLIPESVVVEPSSTSPTTSTGGDNDLEFFLEEGSKYIAEHSVILTPSEQHTISTKRSSMSSGNRNNNNVGGNNRKKVEIDEAKLIEIQDLIEKRFDHKYHREFDEADKIREQLLEEYDVEIFDRNGVWQTRDKSISRPLKGFTASYADKVQPAKPIKCTLSAQEIQRLVEQRTKHRRARKFDLADQIRDQLADGGVEVMDKSNEWRSFDGTLGGLQSEDFGSYR